MTKITIDIGEDYMTQLDERLRKYGISHGALSRASGIAESQLSRWFNTGMQPRLASIARIERAVAELRAERVTTRRKRKPT